MRKREGMSFAAYEAMLAAYNGIASGAADDMAKAESAAAKFVAAGRGAEHACRSGGGASLRR